MKLPILLPALLTLGIAAAGCSMPPAPPVAPVPASARDVRLAVSPDVKIDGLDGDDAKKVGQALFGQVSRALVSAGYRVVEGDGKGDAVVRLDAKLFSSDLVTEAHLTLKRGDEVVGMAEFKGEGNCGDFVGCSFDRVCALLVNSLSESPAWGRAGGGASGGAAPGGASAPSGGGACRGDMDCKGDRICDHGACVAPH